MNENQVVSFDLAKRLYDLGFKHDSFSAYYLNNNQYSLFSNDVYVLGVTKITDVIPAYTSGELLELIPPFIDIKKDFPFNTFDFKLNKRTANNIRWILNYQCDSTTWDGIDSLQPYKLLFHPQIHGEKLADCLAELIIKLIENGFVCAEQIIDSKSFNKLEDALKLMETLGGNDERK